MTAVVAFNASSVADDTKKSKTNLDFEKLKEQLVIRERILKARFGEFRAQLLRLKERYDRGTEKNKERAKVFERVLEEVKNRSIDTRFAKLIEELEKGNFKSLPELRGTLKSSAALAADLRQLLAMIREGSSVLELRDKRNELKELVKELDRIINEQARVQTKTNRINEGKENSRAVQDAQKKLNEKTNKLVKKLGGQGIPVEIARSEVKSSGDKGGEAQSGQGKEFKGKGNEDKAGQGKSGGKEGKGDKGHKGGAKGDGKD